MINPTTKDLLTILRANPHQDLISVWTVDYKSWLLITTQTIVLHCDGNKWWWYYRDGHNSSIKDVVNPTQFKSLDPKDVHAEIDRVLNIAKQTHTETQTVKHEITEQTTMTEKTDISGNHVFRLLYDYHFPTMKYLRLSLDGMCQFFLSGKTWRFDYDAWEVGDKKIEHNLGFAEDVTAELLHTEINRVLLQIKSSDGEQKIVEGQPEQTFVSIDRYRELEAELKTVTKDRDTYKARQEYTQEVLNQIWDVIGWPEKFDEPDAIGYIKRLKSKADRAGLLSVVCRRLCGDENATSETVHKAIDRCHDEATTIEFIGERLGIDPDGMDVTHLGEIRSLVAQTVKSLGEKTVEVAKLQEGIKNYEAQLKGYAANKRLQEFARIQAILNNAEVATVYDYETDRPVPTDERVRILCERLKENVVGRLDNGAKMHQLSDEIRQAHLTLNDLNAARCMGTIDLSLSARIRSVFQTHTKV